MSQRLRTLSPSAWLVVLLTVLGFGLRVWRLDAVPPGWRDDELSNVFAISQKVLDGDWRLYYADASGHEGLYHALVAGMIALFGRIPFALRGVSVIFGTLTIPLTYWVGKQLFSRRVALLAAAALTVSFWSLMYSRTGIRHISMPVFMLAGFALFWRGMAPQRPDSPTEKRFFALSGLFLGVGLYTYFAARGAPAIVLAGCAVVMLFDRPLWRQRWRGVLWLGVVLLALAVPLVLTLNSQPEGVYRVEELAAPLTELLDGDPQRFFEHVRRTINMFHSDGDDEYLYNVPFRPIFHPVIASVFWLGVALSVWATGQLWRRTRAGDAERGHLLAYPFLLLWWLAGIAPSLISIPAGSLGHTIAAQSATYLLLALPLDWLIARRPSLRPAAWLIGVVIVVAIAARDLPAYFVEWPSYGQTRFLYRADIHGVADYVTDPTSTLADFGISGVLAGPWDRLALGLNVGDAVVRPRWFNPQRAIMLELSGEPALNFHDYPEGEEAYDALYEPIATVGGYALGRVAAQPAGGPRGCFTNGLCVDSAEYDSATGQLDLTFSVAAPLSLPPLPVVSFPPPPGVYAGPRLAVFAHVRDAQDGVIAGDDGLWVDPLTLLPDDRFRQRHYLQWPDSADNYTIAFGLYDPLTGERILTTSGDDHIRLTVP